MRELWRRMGLPGQLSILVFVTTIGFLLLSLWFAPVPKSWDKIPQPKRTTDVAQIFGDVAGTIVSTIALVMVVYTVRQQNEALDLQQKEMTQAAELQREQLRLANKTARLSAATTLAEYHNRELDRINPNSTRLHELAFKYHGEQAKKYRQLLESFLESDENQ